MKILNLMFLLCMGMTASSQLNVDIREFKLENGLDVIMHQDNSTPIVSVSVMYHVGSKNESPDRTGFAHFFEHLMFEATENIKRGDYSKYVESAGGTLNANTSYDRTYYFEILPSNELELGLWLESERMLHARVDDIGIETQRQVVKEEKRQTMDNQPYGTVLAESTKRAYKGYPYSWPIIGSIEHLDAAQEVDYKNFYATFYVPNNAVLVIAGDIDYAETEKLVRKYYSEIPTGTRDIPRPNGNPAPLTEEIRDTIYDNIQLPAVVQTYRTVSLKHPDYYAVNMMSQLLSQGKASRLNKALVDEKQLALFVGSFPLDLEDPSINLAFGIANAGVDVAKVEEAMDEEVRKISTDLISEDEFNKLRNQIEVNLINRNGRIEGIAENLASAKTYHDDASRVNTELNRFLAVTREDIRRVAKKYLVKNNRVVLHYLPKQAKP